MLVGPLTYLLLAKPAVDGFRPLSLLDGLVDVYAEVLERLAGAGAEWVQLDEPALVEDRTSEEIDALARAYARLGRLTSRPRLMVATYFGTIGVDALRVLARSRVEAVGLDLVAGAQNVDVLASVGGLPRKTLVAGVVDGRNVWRTDQRRARATTASLLGLVDRLVVSTSCSLMHVPIDLEAETSLATEVRSRLAFARQKVGEVVALGRALREDVPAEAAATGPAVDRAVRERVKAIGDARRGDRAVRFAAQRRRWGCPRWPRPRSARSRRRPRSAGSALTGVPGASPRRPTHGR